MIRKPLSKVLCIGGSDSSGGAGIQADIAAVRRAGAFPLTAITCVTAQSAQGLIDLEPVSQNILALQMESALRDAKPRAVKLGLIVDFYQAELILQLLKKYGPEWIVIDPVMAPTAGKCITSTVWQDNGLVREFAALGAIFTPNRIELEKMMDGYTEQKFKNHATEMAYVKKRLSFASEFLGINQILLKNGHSRHLRQVDILVNDSKIIYLNHDFPEACNVHGTGCSLASYLAAKLALGKSLPQAARMAVDFLQRELANATRFVFYPDQPEASGACQLPK